MNEVRGFFDLQVNGFAGIDFQKDRLTARELTRAVEALHAHGTTRILLTLVTDDVDRMCRRLETIEALRTINPTIAATIVGYHLEGPYLLPEPGFGGAHSVEYMRRPKLSELEQFWSASNGKLRLMTLAPELPGASEFIDACVARGVRVAIGHSNADEDAIDEAIRAGATLCTHLGNAVPQMVHRHQNVMQRLLARDELIASFIPDGIHLPPYVLKNFVRAKKINRVIFTTDGMSAAGARPGYYYLGKMRTRVGRDGVVRQPGNKSYFAGSSLTMDRAVENVQTFLGWTAAQAIAACSTRVASYLGYAK